MHRRDKSSTGNWGLTWSTISPILMSTKKIPFTGKGDPKIKSTDLEISSGAKKGCRSEFQPQKIQMTWGRGGQRSYLLDGEKGTLCVGGLTVNIP